MRNLSLIYSFGAVQSLGIPEVLASDRLVGAGGVRVCGPTGESLFDVPTLMSTLRDRHVSVILPKSVGGEVYDRKEMKFSSSPSLPNHLAC